MWHFAGNIGAELSYSNVGMFISSDAGNSWRQVGVTLVLDCFFKKVISADFLLIFFVYI